MSMHCNLRGKSPYKQQGVYHQTSYSQLPPLLNLSQSQCFNTQSAYSVSKLLKTQITKSEQASIHETTQETVKPYKLLKKDTIDSTQPSDKRLKDIAALEKKLIYSTSTENNLKFKYSLAQEAWKDLLALKNPANNLLFLIKTIVEEWVGFIEKNSENSIAFEEELTENKQTLKILKKRFKKVAAEVLEISEKLEKKNEKLQDLKEKNRKIIKEFSVKMDERERLIGSLTGEIGKTEEKFRNLQMRVEVYKEKIANMNLVLERVREATGMQEVLELIKDKNVTISEAKMNNSSVKFDIDSVISPEDLKKQSFFNCSESLLNLSEF